MNQILQRCVLFEFSSEFQQLVDDSCEELVVDDGHCMG
jgi:hypothetical protein